MKNSIFEKCITQTSIFKSSVLNEDIKIRQLTIAESEEVDLIHNDKDKTQKDIISYCVKCCLVEPTYPTNEEIKKFTRLWTSFETEVYNKIPYIGMNEEQKEKFNEKIKELLKIDAESDKEDAEKK